MDDSVCATRPLKARLIIGLTLGRVRIRLSGMLVGVRNSREEGERGESDREKCMGSVLEIREGQRKRTKQTN